MIIWLLPDNSGKVNSRSMSPSEDSLQGHGNHFSTPLVGLLCIIGAVDS